MTPISPFPPGCVFFSAQTRCKSILGFLNDIVLQTARRLDTAAKLKIDDPAAVFTPFATTTWNLELNLADG